MPRLRTSRLDRLGITRVRHGKGFRYTVDGAPLTDQADRDRIEALVIPPAWEDVWISPHANGHIQAVGTDAAGRRQYLYHEAWRTARDRVKFERALELAAVLPAARRSVAARLAMTEASRDRALAMAFRFLDAASPRLGGEGYLATNGSRGLTTLLRRHVTLDHDQVALAFVGKGGKDWTSDFRDASLAAAIRSMRLPAESRLLVYRADGEWRPVGAADVNAYIAERTGGEFTAKDFRTLHGTVTAALTLAELGTTDSATEARRRITAAVAATADALGNTPTVARASYIDPRLFDRYRQGEVIAASTERGAEGELEALIGRASSS